MAFENTAWITFSSQFEIFLQSWRSGNLQRSSPLLLNLSYFLFFSIVPNIQHENTGAGGSNDTESWQCGTAVTHRKAEMSLMPVSVTLPADSWEFLFSASKCALMEMVQYLGWSPHYFVYIIGTKESERCLTSTVKMIITQLQRLLLLFSSASELGVFRRGGVMGVCSRNMAERGNNWNCCIICPPHYVWKRLVFMNCDHIIRQKWNTQTSKRPIKIK